MSNRWAQNSPERKIEAFIGAWGVKTGDIQNTEHLLDIASRLFEIKNTGIADVMAAEIDRLGRKERKRVAHKNIERVMGSKGRFSKPQNVEANTEQPSISNLQKMMDDSRPVLIDGAPAGCEGQLDIDPAKLLRKVVSAVISSGHQEILYEFPELLAFFGARIPERDELYDHSNLDEKMFVAKEKWPNLRKQ